MTVIALVIAWLVAACALLALTHRRALRAAWQEPVLRVPVVIIESDDWGYGPPEQAERLERIAGLLGGFRDSRGRTPVMTVGVVLAGPDTAAIRADDCQRYYRISLTDPPLAAVRGAMLAGAAHGVFALQLHGNEHFWPDCLLRAATTDERVRDWLTAPGFPSTEDLPSPLQSRWIDATTLPSRSLPSDAIAADATAEVTRFADAFGAKPDVAVPTTFVWTREAEAAWVRAGVRVVVTPGRRSERRDEDGALAYTGEAHWNGAVGPGGATYVVRDSYFEPALGHTHQQALDAVAAKTRLGRPTLLEMHRANFMATSEVANLAFDELRLFLDAARNRFHNARFMSTAELAANFGAPSDLVATRLHVRAHFLLRRVWHHSRLRKLAWLTGAIAPAWLVYALTRPHVAGGPPTRVP